MDRVCKICEKTKPLEDFSKNKRCRYGRSHQCKQCVIEKVTEWNKSHPERRREIRNRWRGENYDKARKSEAASYARHRDRVLARSKKYEQNNPKKKRAHAAVGHALKSGKLARPMRCERCGLTGKIHAHHEGYARPLEVAWLCAKCHRAIHNPLEVAA